MFCPQCGSTQGDDLKFCKLCGANLEAVRRAASAGAAGGQIDWSKTWVAEMFLSGEEAARRKAELERLQGITPEVKRYREIKAGVITSCAGLAVVFVLYNVLESIALGGKVPHDTARILMSLWVVGLIPIFVGLALIINGLFVSKKMVELARRESLGGPNALDEGARPAALPPADTAEFVPSGFSVTEETTMHLKGPGPKQ